MMAQARAHRGSGWFLAVPLAARAGWGSGGRHLKIERDDGGVMRVLSVILLCLEVHIEVLAGERWLLRGVFLGLVGVRFRLCRQGDGQGRGRLLAGVALLG